jgi:hypothetical protein
VPQGAVSASVPSGNPISMAAEIPIAFFMGPTFPR